MINSGYLNDLSQLAKTKLKEKYNIEEFDLDDYELINFFLIDKTLNQDTDSLSINYPNRDDKSDFYIPLLLSVAATLFYQNYVDDITSYEVGEIVQKDGRRYRITQKKADGFTLVSEDGTQLFPSNKSINKYIVTTADLSNRRVKTKFNDYRDLYKLLFNEVYVPSKFTYKSAIILERKDFLESLKTSRFPSIDIRKAIPFKWVTKKGMHDNSSDYLPIEPMIYLLPDYESFKEFVYDEIDKLDSVIFIGRNKYLSNITNIRRDLRTEVIPRTIFVGSEEIDQFGNLKKWKWTQPELDYFENNEKGTINLINVNPEKFLKSIENLEDRIVELEREYCFNFNSIIRLKKYLHSLIIPASTSRLTSQIEYVKHLYHKEINTVISDSFFEINKSPTQIIEELITLVDEIFDDIPLDKFEEFKNSENVNSLIVSEKFIYAWQEDLTNEANRRISNHLKIISFKEFKSLCPTLTTNKKFCFLTLFGFKDTPEYVIRFISQSNLNYTFFLYPEEKQLAENLIARYQNELINEYKSQDRFNLCKIEYPDNELDEDVEDVLNRLYSQEDFESRDYVYDQSENIEYEIIFESGSTTILEGNKSVLIEKGILNRKEKVSNLIAGDNIRVYENASKEKLFEIASESDDRGILNEILEYSQLWKNCLRNYFTSKESVSYSESDLLKELQNHGAKIQLITLKKWLNLNDRDLFPSQTLNLIAIKETINDSVFDDNLSLLKKNKKLYRSIMIALGRDLSDEVMDYIISEKQKIGNILSRFTQEQIDRIIDSNAPIETIKSIRIIESNDNE